MRMEIRGRNVEMTDDLRELVSKRFNRLGRQVWGLATLDVVLYEGRAGTVTSTVQVPAHDKARGEVTRGGQADIEVSA